MALSANTRKLNDYKNLVLYMDIQFRDGGTRMDNFLAEIHEATPKDFDSYPSLPIGNNPIFHSYGKRFNEFQATLAFLDVLFGYPSPQALRRELESWILTLKDRRPIAYQICLKVRDQGILQDPREPKSRLAHQLTCEPPELVSKDGFGTLKDAVTYGQQITAQLDQSTVKTHK